MVITNGFFSKDSAKIHEVAKNLAESGVNAILLSVDAFHQEIIPLEPIKVFAEEVQALGIWIRTHPAWLVGETDRNSYNEKTRELLKQFDEMGISNSDGNIIFPSGSALKYLKQYFTAGKKHENPYKQDPRDIHAISFRYNGDVLGGNIYKTDIMDILEGYMPD